MSLHEDSLFKSLADSQNVRDEAMRYDRRIADSIRASLTPHQLAVIKDESRFKSALCARRAGKSFTAMGYAFDTCLRSRGARVVIVTLTLKSAKNIYWEPMREFTSRYGINCRFFINEQRVRLENGSEIMLIGAESRAQIDKLRGGQYDLVIIDECKSYPPSVLSELINEVISPALLDRRGNMLMIGTPGSILDGPFFLATFPGAKHPKTGKLYSRFYSDPEPYWKNRPNDHSWNWSRHSWGIKDNPYLPEGSWEEALRIKEVNGWDDDHPIWQREWLGNWVTSDTTFVYSFAKLSHTEPDKVYWEPDFKNNNPFGLPHQGPWYFVLGMDLGFEDDFAAVVCAYSPFDRTLYQVWEFKDNHQDMDQVAMHIARAGELVGEPGFTSVVADAGGLGKLLVETLNRRHGWNIQPAEKRDKYDHIELINTDFQAGRLKLLRHSDLATELQALQWDTGKASKEYLARTGKLREHPSFPNHLADALLYLFRFSYHYWADDRPVVAPPGSNQWYEEYKANAIARLLEERGAADNGSITADVERMSVDPLKGFYGN